jgi:parallel beta-helix repeat protein
LHVGAGQQYATIQSAVNAANNGDLVAVSPGTYQEQVTITKSIEVEAVSQGCSGGTATILAPAGLGAPTVANPDAIVHVTGSGVSAEIEGFTIEGASAGQANLLYGVRVDGGASAQIDFNTIANIIDTSNAVLGVGVSVGNAASSDDGLGAQVGSAAVVGNSIINYQRAGVVITNTGSWGLVLSDYISATSSTPSDSVTGIEVSEGASATVAFNIIVNNTNGSNGCGVLLFSPGQGTEIAFNAISGNDYGVFGDTVTGNAGTCGRSSYFGYGCGGDWGSMCGGDFGGRGVSVDANVISGNTYVGIEFDYSTGVYISANHIFNNGGDNFEDGGIFLFQSTGNVVINNQSLNNNGSGIFIDAGSTGNTISGNTFTGNVYSSLASGNASADAVDLTTGNVTDGTANTWIGNTGNTSITESGASLLKSKPKHFGFGY